LPTPAFAPDTAPVDPSGPGELRVPAVHSAANSASDPRSAPGFSAAPPVRPRRRNFGFSPLEIHIHLTDTVNAAAAAGAAIRAGGNKIVRAAREAAA